MAKEGPSSYGNNSTSEFDQTGASDTLSASSTQPSEEPLITQQKEVESRPENVNLFSENHRNHQPDFDINSNQETMLTSASQDQKDHLPRNTEITSTQLSAIEEISNIFKRIEESKKRIKQNEAILLAAELETTEMYQQFCLEMARLNPLDINPIDVTELFQRQRDIATTPYPNHNEPRKTSRLEKQEANQQINILHPTIIMDNLTHAALRGDVGFFKYILDTFPDIYKDTPIFHKKYFSIAMLACKNENFRIITLLLEDYRQLLTDTDIGTLFGLNFEDASPRLLNSFLSREDIANQILNSFPTIVDNNCFSAAEYLLEKYASNLLPCNLDKATELLTQKAEKLQNQKDKVSEKGENDTISVARIYRLISAINQAKASQESPTLIFSKILTSCRLTCDEEIPDFDQGLEEALRFSLQESKTHRSI